MEDPPIANLRFMLDVSVTPTEEGLTVQAQCPSGLSFFSADDAYDFANRILNELLRHNYESRSLRESKKRFDEILANTTDEELEAYFGQCIDKSEDQSSRIDLELSLNHMMDGYPSTVHSRM